MRILITGGAGFIAYHLAARLQDERFDVVLLDNFNSFYDPALKRKNVRDLESRGPIKLHETDILDVARLRRTFEETRPHAVVHLAAWAGVRPSLENPEIYAGVNVSGTLNVLQLARAFEVESFIFGSSSSVYGGSERVPFSEDDPVDRPVSPYAATKRAGELLCHTYACNYAMHITCLRFFTVYGPRQRPEMAIHKFAQLMQEGKEIPVYGDGESRRDYTYVDDIISGVVSALRVNPRFAIINLGESRTTTLSQLISLLEEALGKRATRRLLPEQPGDMRITYADISRARQILGYQPTTPIEEGIRKFAAWFLNKT
ncbi:MAG: GDP-mannose 4,6-dehydratase [Acidobacteriia bacterium]|nr:GDP-mannose 4,6-dehydratase [Terriglobia bacterium]